MSHQCFCRRAVFGLFAFQKKASLLFLIGGVVLVGKILFSMMEVDDGHCKSVSNWCTFDCGYNW